MRRTFVILAFFLALALFLGKAYYDTNTVEVKYYVIKDSRLSEALAGLKVAFLTDLHIKSIDVREKNVLQILGEENPDLLLLTGDYIGFKGPYEPVMLFFQQLKAPHGVYGVMGNTEYSNENGSCVLCHHEKSRNLKAKPHPIFLRNDTERFEANQRRINILGVDDPVKKKGDLKAALQKADLDLPSILLAHSPEIFEEATASGIDLVLCGHDHGGQVFMTRLLRKILPFDPVLEYMEGFFQKGKTVMYVSRGIGTSYLPFRFGVKPEVTFLEFANDIYKKTNDTKKNIQIARINSTSAPQHSSTLLLSPQSFVNPTISNHPPQMVFAGLSLTNLVETFNFFAGIRDKFERSGWHHSNVLFDFESDEELRRLNWECGKWLERSEKHATSGTSSLRLSIPPGEYPGINFEKIKKNWSGVRSFAMDVFNPSEERVTFHIRIDDNKSGWEYANRFDINFTLNPGMNRISIPADSIRTNLHHRPLNLRRIERMMVFVPHNAKRRELYIDHIRLE